MPWPLHVTKFVFECFFCMLVFSQRLFLNCIVRKFFEFLTLILRFSFHHIIISYLKINSVFLSRHNISFKVIGGESKSGKKQMVAPWNETTLPTLLSKYDLKYIFNADEFGLFYQCLPKKNVILKVKHALEERIAK